LYGKKYRLKQQQSNIFKSYAQKTRTSKYSLTRDDNAKKL